MREAIYYRRSHRAYEEGPLDGEVIAEVLDVARKMKPLYSNIKTFITLLDSSEVYVRQDWTPKQFIAIYSEQAEGYITNAGFILGQVDLYLQSLGYGACYIGLGKPNDGGAISRPDGMEFVMLLAFGKTRENMREGAPEFNRKALLEISDTADARLEPARLSPSAMNSQSWYFVGRDGGFHLFRREITRSVAVIRLNRFDVGLALANLYVAYPDTFAHFKDTPTPVLSNSEYITTVTL